MQHLPVPPLSDTMQRYLAVVRPLLDAEAYAETERVVAEFAQGEGPRLQQMLEEFAQAENAAGRSWLTDAWLEGYWQVRTPLPLTSSIAMQIDWETDDDGLARAAGIIHRLATIHLLHLRHRIEPEVSPRGIGICPQQRRYLAGGQRRPRTNMDDYQFGPMESAHREIGVLWRGNLVTLQISDDRGMPLPPSALRQALERVKDLPASKTSPVDVSYLGSDVVADYLAELTNDPANDATYRRLVDTVFMVTLIDEAADDVAHLERVNFALSQAWAYKTVTYQIGLGDTFVAMHVEHSLPDGATVEKVVSMAQELDLQEINDETSAVPDATPEPLQWQLTEELTQRLNGDLAAYRAEAANYRAQIVSVPLPPRPELPFRISADACQQFVMLYAQLKTYGRVRNTYEAVDMREYQAGRTEAMRPNTTEAVSLVRSLIDGTATPDELTAALAAHRDRVKSAKAGNAVDRHLLGLQRMAEQADLHPQLFADTAYQLLSTNFLSTTSLGRRKPIIRVSFAPVTPDGIGLYYTASHADYEFSIMWREDHCVRIDDFIDALGEGTQALEALIASVADG